MMLIGSRDILENRVGHMYCRVRRQMQQGLEKGKNQLL